MQTVVAALDRTLPALIAELTDRAIADRIQPFSSMPREQLVQLLRMALGGFQRDLADGTRAHFAEYWRKVGSVRAEEGSRIDDMLQFSILGENVMNAHMLDAL